MNKRNNVILYLILILSVVISVFAVPSDTESHDVKDPAVPSPRYCPEVSELVKDDVWWMTKDKAWKCYTQSFTKKIKNFIGAQWTGIKVGKMICLYVGEEDFAFPLSLEQVYNQQVLEPKHNNWSAPINSYRLCKSTDVRSCPFYVKAEPEVSDIYEQIKYVDHKGSD